MAGGRVNNHMASKSLRRKTFKSEVITVSNGATANLLLCVGNTSPNARFVVERITIVNEGAISNHAGGTLKVGHATSAGTFDDDSVLTSYTLPGSGGGTLTAKAQQTLTHGSMASTLKTSSGLLVGGRPVVPAASSIWTTATAMASSGTGTIRVFITGWELDDETSNA